MENTRPKNELFRGTRADKPFTSSPVLVLIYYKTQVSIETNKL